MSSLIKKYVFFGLFSAAIAAPYGSTNAAEATAIISKIQIAATQDGYAKAIQVLDKELAKNKDIKLELLIIKAQLNFKNQKFKESIDIYKNLIKDYPKNLILYNNLAAIYGDQGDLEAAELILLDGLKQQLDVDLVFQNLIRIKGKQASIALQMALDPSRAILKNTQLTILNKVNGLDLSASQQSSPQNKLPTNILPEKSREVVALNTFDSKPQPNAALSETEKINPIPEPIKDSLNSSTQPIKNPQPSTEGEIPNLLNAWANAWSMGNAEGYLSYYSPKFVPEGQISAEKWSAQRRQRIKPDQGIHVRLENIEIEIKGGNLIEASFKQFYTSRTLKAQANKKITLELQNNQWKIIREEVVK